MLKTKYILVLIIFFTIKSYSNTTNDNIPAEKTFGLSFGFATYLSPMFSYGSLVSIHYKSKLHRLLKIGIGIRLHKDYQHYGLSTLFCFYPLIKSENFSKIQFLLGSGISVNSYGNVKESVYLKPGINFELGGEVFLRKDISLYCNYSPSINASIYIEKTTHFDRIGVANDVNAGLNFYFSKSTKNEESF